MLSQRQCLFLNVDTDADTIANIETILLLLLLLLLLIYFKWTNNVDKTSKFLFKINVHYWIMNVHKSQLPKNV